MIDIHHYIIKQDRFFTEAVSLYLLGENKIDLALHLQFSATSPDLFGITDLRAYLKDFVYEAEVCLRFGILVKGLLSYFSCTRIEDIQKERVSTGVFVLYCIV